MVVVKGDNISGDLYKKLLGSHIMLLQKTISLLIFKRITKYNYIETQAIIFLYRVPVKNKILHELWLVILLELYKTPNFIRTL